MSSLVGLWYYLNQKGNVFNMGIKKYCLNSLED